MGKRWGARHCEWHSGGANSGVAKHVVSGPNWQHHFYDNLSWARRQLSWLALKATLEGIEEAHREEALTMRAQYAVVHGC